MTNCGVTIVTRRHPSCFDSSGSMGSLGGELNVLVGGQGREVWPEDLLQECFESFNVNCSSVHPWRRHVFQSCGAIRRPNLDL